MFQNLSTLPASSATLRPRCTEGSYIAATIEVSVGSMSQERSARSLTLDINYLECQTSRGRSPLHHPRFNDGFHLRRVDVLV